MTCHHCGIELIDFRCPNDAVHGWYEYEPEAKPAPRDWRRRLERICPVFWAMMCEARARARVAQKAVTP
jgi:hypothetical protein